MSESGYEIFNYFEKETDEAKESEKEIIGKNYTIRIPDVKIVNDQIVLKSKKEKTYFFSLEYGERLNICKEKNIFIGLAYNMKKIIQKYFFQDESCISIKVKYEEYSVDKKEIYEITRYFTGEKAYVFDSKDIEPIDLNFFAKNKEVRKILYGKNNIRKIELYFLLSKIYPDEYAKDFKDFFKFLERVDNFFTQVIFSEKNNGTTVNYVVNM